MPFAMINGITLHYRLQRAGSDRPVVAFSNSLGTDSRIWDAVTDRLAGDFTLLTYDKRGHGLSGLGNPPYAIYDHAADLAGLLDHLDLQNVVVCGLSVGGLIAQALYAARPDLVGALILSNTADRIGTPDMWAARIAAVESGGLESLLEPIMQRWFTPAYRQADNAAYQAYCNMLLRQPASGYSGTCAAIRDADLTAQTPKIAVPTLCIAGSDDGSTPPDLVMGLAARVPGAACELIDAVGHIPCVEAPAVYAAIVRRFVETLE